ncbi:hypothetical protein [Methylobacterium sp. ID0610]|uniref:hypothetical protein n=1 Tax=Methylobacterium carpenticola TaxID=3344827 RepID=UPI0036A67F00
MEFALLATILIALSAAGVDLINLTTLTREIERSTTQLAAAITSCPASSTPGYASCTTDTIKQLTDRKTNALVTLIRLLRDPTNQPQLSIIQVNKVNGAIRVCAGTATYLDADINTSALQILGDKDVAIVVLITGTYVPYVGFMSKLFTGTETSALRGYTVAVQVSNVQLC